ncbi:hypothetical protein GT030_24280 [Streptomyces sp. SID1328]|uniref:helix-turn-helix domain-containing protein n=1 Tax=Streptomyces sp. SID1328 TaxID=2690250 RepID=UPI00136DC6C6|nr:helix-turn-helix transcriptional regulator [Streptomyces sp. SID1328]MYV41898.1 hypothetical protein [Streptomyces sp. SID1328]
MTMSRLGDALHISKSKISELLSGKFYPRWELLYDLAVALGISFWPLYRLWRQAALETENKSRTWVDNSTSRVQGTMTATRSTPPLDLTAFRDLTENGYRLYAGVFLIGPYCQAAIDKTYDRLWLSWNQALASPDARRYAFTVLRGAHQPEGTAAGSPPHSCPPAQRDVVARCRRPRTGFRVALVREGGRSPVPGVEVGPVPERPGAVTGRR